MIDIAKRSKGTKTIWLSSVKKHDNLPSLCQAAMRGKKITRHCSPRIIFSFQHLHSDISAKIGHDRLLRMDVFMSRLKYWGSCKWNSGLLCQSGSPWRQGEGTIDDTVWKRFISNFPLKRGRVFLHQQCSWLKLTTIRLTAVVVCVDDFALRWWLYLVSS